MYPGVIIEYNDQSNITSLPVTEVRNRPFFMALFTSDKGTEKWTRMVGEDFFKMYGKTISFAKHGQPLLQAAMTINAGAELLCKRLVASDAKLANLGIVASIKDSQVQATDEDGNLLYLDADGEETVEVTDNPSMVDGKAISYSVMTADNATTPQEAYDAISAKLTDGQHLIYVICDNGRGTSKKRIRITPNYKLSKNMEYTLYTLSVIEGSEVVESMNFSINPNLIVSGQNISLYSMINTNSTQLVCVDDSTGIESFITALSEAAGVDEDTLYSYDPLFGCTNRGAALEGIIVDNAGIDLQYATGQILQSGSNGAFDTHPIKNTEEFGTQAIVALNGTFDPAIFNVDQYRLQAVIDANYPDTVKRAIEALAIFREDFMYFRDQGLGVNNLDLVIENSAKETKSKFCATYFQSYDIIDPYTKKQIPVTIGYSLARLLVEHCNNGVNLPTAGFKHNMIINDAVYGTLSFTPTICPDPIGNQKEILEDMHINYASYIDNQLVVESLYTSQEKNTQWSYINNVMSIQEVVKAIRIRCPVIRYTFIEGEDLERYRADVEEVIAPFRNNFKTLELEYVEDPTYSANKIFYAALKVVYKDFIQTEWFTITALADVSVLTS